MRDKIRRLRREMELTQTAVAEQFGISVSILCRYEKYGEPLSNGVRPEDILLWLGSARDATAGDHTK